MAELKEAFKFADIDKSGKLDKDELEELLNNLDGFDVSEDAIVEMMTVADINGDGNVSFREFCKVTVMEY
jgi:Ca2+-binding EF-hand superfamily protein